MPKIGHTYSEKPTSKDDTHHTGLCAICGTSFEEEHYGMDDDNTCDGCGYEKKVIGWTQATSETDLQVGYQILLAYVPSSGDTYIGSSSSALSSNRIPAAKFTIPTSNTFSNEDLVKSSTTMTPFILGKDSSNKYYTLKLGNMFIGHSDGTKFSTNSSATSTSYYWTITIATNGEASIKNVSTSRYIALYNTDYRPYSENDATKKPRIYWMPAAE